jgi:hypothetical protein
MTFKQKLTSGGPKHCDAQRTAMAIMGAVVRLTGNRFRPRNGTGTATGCITKIMDSRKSTKVAIEDPETIECDLHQLYLSYARGQSESVVMDGPD